MTWLAIRDTGHTSATIGKNLIIVNRPELYRIRIAAGPTRRRTQPIDETVSSIALTGSPSAIGLKRKNLGKVRTSTPMNIEMNSPIPPTANWWLIFECSS